MTCVAHEPTVGTETRNGGANHAQALDPVARPARGAGDGARRAALERQPRRRAGARDLSRRRRRLDRGGDRRAARSAALAMRAGRGDRLVPDRPGAGRPDRGLEPGCGVRAGDSRLPASDVLDSRARLRLGRCRRPRLGVVRGDPRRRLPRARRASGPARPTRRSSCGRSSSCRRRTTAAVAPGRCRSRAASAGRRSGRRPTRRPGGLRPHRRERLVPASQPRGAACRAHRRGGRATSTRPSRSSSSAFAGAGDRLRPDRRRRPRWSHLSCRGAAPTYFAVVGHQGPSDPGTFTLSGVVAQPASVSPGSCRPAACARACTT